MLELESLLDQIVVFMLVLIRVATIVVIMPFIGYRTIPNKVKIGFAVLLSLIIVPLLPPTHLTPPANLVALFFQIGKEVVAGLIIGFTSEIIFKAFLFAGTLIGIDMGFDMIQVLDPQSGGQVSLLGEFLNITALMFFLVIDGHHFLIKALVQSFQIIPLTGMNLSEKLIGKIVQMTAEVFVLAIKISIPVVATLWLTNVALGILSKAVPQMNVFSISFPLKIGVGILTLTTFIPLFTLLFQKLMRIFEKDMLTIFKLLAP